MRKPISANIGPAVILAGLMLFCAALSYFFFMGQSLRLDEAQSLWQSSRSPLDILTLVAQDVHVPLYHELLHFWRLYLGNTVTAARLMSLLFYLLSIPAIYALGKLAYGRAIGLFAAFLLAISPFMNWYGNEIRMYTLFTLFTILNQLFFVRMFQGKEADRDSLSTWLGYGITAVLGVFVHYFFFLNFVAQAAFYFFRRRLFPEHALRNFLIIAAVIIAAFAPWAWYVFAQGEAVNQEPLLPIPSTVNLFSAFSQFLFGFQTDNVNTAFLSLWPATIIIALLALRRNQRISPATEYFLFSVVLSIGIAFFISFVVPVFVSRYLIFTVPSLYLLLTSLLWNLSPRQAHIARPLLAGLMVVMLGVEIWSPTTPVKEDYRDAVTYIQANATPQDILILSAPFTIYPVEYYYRGEAPMATLPVWDRYAHGSIPPFIPDQLPTQATDLSKDYQEAWLLLSYDQGYQTQIKDYFDSHYQMLQHKNFSPNLDLYVYRIRYDTALSQAISTRTVAEKKSPAR